MANDIKDTDLEDINDDIRPEERNYNGVVSIWNNPNAGSTTCSRRQYYSSSSRANKFQGGTIPDRNLNPGDNIQATDYNTFAQDVQQVGINVENTFGSSTGQSSIPTAAPNTDIPQSNIDTLNSVLSNIIALLDSKDSWWDGSNKCARSCQIQCQTSCQISCQGCNSYQCHNQKCGVH